MLNGDLSSAKAILGKKPPSNTLELEVENVAKNYIQVSDDFILDDSEYGVVSNNPYEEESTESTVDDEMEYDPNYVDPYYSIFIIHE